MMVFVLVSACIHVCVLLFGWTDSVSIEDPAVEVQMGISSLNIFLPDLTPPKPVPEPVIEVIEELPHESDPIKEKNENPSQEKEQEIPESAVGDEGADAPAALIGNSKPDYPRLSIIREEEGIVAILVTVSAQGKCSAVEVVSSSGYKRLDHSAVTWAKKVAKYRPQKKGGKSVISELKIRVPFRFRKGGSR
jgi:TonB family protein